MLKVVNVATGAIVAAYSLELLRDAQPNETPLGRQNRSALNKKVSERNAQRVVDAERLVKLLNAHQTQLGMPAVYDVWDTGTDDFYGEAVEGCRA